MGSELVVVALGRNAFGRTLPQQQKNVKLAAEAIADLVEEKYRVVITHSNGPQIGMLHTAMTEFSRLEPDYTSAPMSVCGALSQGYIGYDLQNAIRTELLNRGIYKTVSTIITQVQVDPFDKAFNRPTKIIGRLMDKADADKEVEKGNYVTKEDGGYRRIIPSPMPMKIYEIDAIKALADAGQVVIAAGGGGIPVLEQGTVLKGASAIIEKDYTAARMAQMLEADALLFLTKSQFMTIHQGTEEKPLEKVTLSEVEKYISEGKFGEGTIMPKMEASVEFVSSQKGRKAVITSMEHALQGMEGETGTILVSE